MKQYKKLTATALLLAIALNLFPLFALADSYAKRDSYIYSNSSASVRSRCDTQDAPSLFVLKALLTNPENPYPIELWENRDNEQINIFEIAREIKSIASLKEKIFNNADEAKRARLFERLAQMEDIADRALLMEADKWKPHYVNELMKHIIGIRHYGLGNLLPDIVDPSNCKEEPTDGKVEDINSYTDEEREYLKKVDILNPCDKGGKHWTSLSNLDNTKECPSIADYMRHHGADIELIKSWWSAQVSDSWTTRTRALKAFYANQQTTDHRDYYWSKEGYEVAEKEYSTLWQNGKHSYIQAFTIWHAYVQEVLSKVKFYHNDQDKKQVCLIRTTGLNSLKSNNISDFGSGYTMPSAVYESYSLLNVFAKGAKNKAIIESKVPHHRILHLYPLLGLTVSKDVNETAPNEIEIAIKKFVEKMKKYYDTNGSLSLDDQDPSFVKKYVEEYIYDEYISIKKFIAKASSYDKAKTIFHEMESAGYKDDLNIIFSKSSQEELEQEALKEIKGIQEFPKKLTIGPSESIEDAIMKLVSKIGNNYESEVIVLSDSDLVFDYFYNADENLSALEEKLENGEGACKGYKLTGAQND